jgi:hypothetical protein
VEAVALALGGAAGLAGGFAAGFKVGERLRAKPSWRYWAFNAAVMVLGVTIVFLGTVYAVPFLWSGGIGLMGGGVTGLKYGYGKSVGLWRVADDLTGTDDLPRD